MAKTSGENHWAYRDDLDDAEILTRLGAGETVAAIAAALRAVPVTVRKRARAAGWTGEWPGEPEAAPVERIRELLAEGANGVEIARALGVSPALVSKQMKTAGLAAPPRRKGWTDERRASFIAKRVGYKHTTESLKKMRASKTGQTLSAEARAKISATLTGKYKGAASSRYRDDINVVEVRARMAAGESQTAIADSLGCARKTLRLRLRAEPEPEPCA